MLTTISKRFRWEMGHRLPQHDGLCKNLHGHSYAMKVFLTGEPDSSGMVMDYFDVTSLVAPLIAELDHAFIADKHDTEVVSFLTANNLKMVVIDVPTTAENLAVYALQFVLSKLPKQHTLVKVALSIQETEKTSAFIEHIFSK